MGGANVEKRACGVAVAEGSDVVTGSTSDTTGSDPDAGREGASANAGC